MSIGSIAPLRGHHCNCRMQFQPKLLYLEEDDLYNESYFFATCCETVWFQQIVSYKDKAKWESIAWSKACEDLDLNCRSADEFRSWVEALKEPIYRRTLP